MSFFGRIFQDKAEQVQNSWSLTAQEITDLSETGVFNAKQLKRISRRFARLSDTEDHPVTWMDFKKSSDCLILDQLEALPEERRAEFWALEDIHRASPNAVKTRTGIFQTNAFTLEGLPTETSALLGIGSRINHNCTPILSRWAEMREGEIHVCFRASRPIAEGEEMCTNYAEMSQRRDKRQAYLLEKFKFSCTCPTCSLTGKKRLKSNKRREKWFTLDDEVMEMVVNAPDKALAGTEQLIQIVHSEFQSMPGMLVRNHNAAYQCALACGPSKVAEAVKHARLTLEYKVLCVGDLPLDNPEVQSAMNPSNHPIARMRGVRLPTKPLPAIFTEKGRHGVSFPIALKALEEERERELGRPLRPDESAIKWGPWK
ncbi:hypothetical protein KIPB_002219 [Kipferlia bialata]|uniref:SET domain-containing protein n=1 Tax=Kipferlia bialata TaxID=797122 RepID=A0A9K3GFT4_9EUKA|nr:hypothetical protein KIPB_002219 [Kipferlia bialata]|eukprot:g2219.t1